MARTLSLELPCGLERGGRVIRPVEIGKLKGRVQRDIARLQSAKSPDAAAIMDAVLKPSLLGLNGEQARTTDIRNMLVADRDWLLFELRKFTWGNLVTTKNECSKCEAMMVYEDFDLTTLETKPLEDDAPWWNGREVISGSEVASMSEQDRQTLVCRVLVLENLDLEARGVFRYPTGLDQGGLTRLANKPVEAAWHMMASTCFQWDDGEHKWDKSQTKKGLPDDFWADLDMDVVGWAQVAFRDGQPGVETNIKVQCDECEHVEEVTLNATDFFFPEVTRKT